MLQVLCVWVLIHLVHNNALTQTTVAKVEGLQAILAAMKRFPSSQDIFSRGFMALNEIAIENEANANLLVTKLGGLPFLID